MTPLPRDFFARDTLQVARDLLGQVLVRILDGERLSGRIVEVEAYIGEDDLASHARFGRTPRNEAMYGPPGHAYVYQIYGLHHCLNIVTEAEGFPAAVLIRALEPLEGLAQMRQRRGISDPLLLTSGPARLCQAMGIDRRLDKADLCAPNAVLFVEPGAPVPDDLVATGPRVGVQGDLRARTIPWRFYLRDHPCVSHRGVTRSRRKDDAC
ncbi:MAG: DNA-3-methyladenine glycosylase [Anaerolineae bacterium]|nr:DNA-3-methyladenine glycosylase [Anaerolineae bacterium]MCX8066602.1 DNA-3-methyladenine glycosylase [Anaerolineae bacterium]MDW7991352.1 DNA-3-methyladenine glycosylase [Anaerolineae bacterium]